jgi:quercetin dioxygenase-like cupin family protein
VKGHVLHILSGELHTELEDGRTFTLSAGTTYLVGDNAEPHRSSAPIGASLLIVD